MRVIAISFSGIIALHPQFFSQRSGWMMFQISATCAVGAVNSKIYQNPFKNAMENAGLTGLTG